MSTILINNKKTISLDLTYGNASPWLYAPPSMDKINVTVNFKNNSIFPDSFFINSKKLLDIIITKLEKKQPYAVVSVGATEAFVMAQYTLFSEAEIMSHPETLIANRGKQSGFEHRGIRLPNIELRNEMIKAVKKADIVGYNTIVKSAQTMTEDVFEIYDIKPPLLFEANIRRVIMFSQKERFENMLAGQKILLIGSLANQAKLSLEQKYKKKLGLHIVGALSINEYNEISQIKDQIAKYDFDLCLLSAGSSAVILSTYISHFFGKVAFDIGWGLQSLITGRVVTDEWLTSIIGINNIMRM